MINNLINTLTSAITPAQPDALVTDSGEKRQQDNSGLFKALFQSLNEQKNEKENGDAATSAQENPGGKEEDGDNDMYVEKKNTLLKEHRFEKEPVKDKPEDAQKAAAGDADTASEIPEFGKKEESVKPEPDIVAAKNLAASPDNSDEMDGLTEEPVDHVKATISENDSVSNKTGDKTENTAYESASGEKTRSDNGEKNEPRIPSEAPVSEKKVPESKHKPEASIERNTSSKEQQTNITPEIPPQKPAEESEGDRTLLVNVENEQKTKAAPPLTSDEKDDSGRQRISTADRVTKTDGSPNRPEVTTPKPELTQKAVASFNQKENDILPKVDKNEIRVNRTASYQKESSFFNDNTDYKGNIDRLSFSRTERVAGFFNQAHLRTGIAGVLKDDMPPIITMPSPAKEKGNETEPLESAAIEKTGKNPEIISTGADIVKRNAILVQKKRSRTDIGKLADRIESGLSGKKTGNTPAAEKPVFSDLQFSRWVSSVNHSPDSTAASMQGMQNEEALWKEFVPETVENGEKSNSEQQAVSYTRLADVTITNISIRKHILPGLSQMVLSSAAENKSPESWQKHNFILEDGSKIQFSARQAEGVMQIRLSSSMGDLQRLLQLHQQKILEHLEKECGLEIDLQLGNRESDDTDARNFFSNTLKPTEPGAGKFHPQSGISSSPSHQKSTREPIRKFGYNQMEWTA